MHIQSSFSKASEAIIRDIFQINVAEKLVAAVWINIARKGFVFTDKRFYWNLPTTIENGSIKQDVAMPTNILQKNVGDLIVNLTFQKSKKQVSEKKPIYTSKPELLVLDSHIGKIKIDISHLDIDDARKLRRIFIDYTAREKYPSDYLSEAPLDMVLFFFQRIQDEIEFSKNKGKQEEVSNTQQKDDVQYINTKNSAQYKNAKDIKTYFSDNARHRISIKSFFNSLIVYAGDVIADLVFVAMTIVSLKPVLLYKNIYKNHTLFSDIIQRIGSFFFRFDSNTSIVLANADLKEDTINLLLYWRNYVFILLLFIFLVLKTVIILISCKRSKKILPLLLLIPIVATCFLLPFHFLLFLICILILYIVMQFALGFLWSALKYKMFAFIVLVFMEYYFLHLFAYPRFVDVIGAVLQLLSFNVRW